MKTQDEIKEQAQSQGLNYVEITHGTNGYPSGLGDIAIIGFENYQQAEDFTSHEGHEIVLIRKRDGWHFWENMGAMNKPLSIYDYVNDLGDNYNIETFDVDSFVERIQDLLISFDGNFSEIDEFIADQKELKEATEALEPDQSIITAYGKVFDVVENEMMGYYHDVWTYKIAVLIRRQ